MSNKEKPEIGSITWSDLTVPNAEEVKDFYSIVVGWKSVPASINSDFPPQWLIYITVKSADESAELCEQNGGKVLVGPKEMSGYGRYCIIEDPAGAVCALFEPS
jgi:predicted enzyme related to lactoylglutathione lyase